MKDRLARKNKALADDIELEHVVGDPFFYTILVAKAPGELYNTAAWAEFGKRWADYNKGLTLEEKQSFEVVLMPSKTRLYEIKSLLYAEHLDKAEKAAAAAEGMEVEPTYEGEPAQEIKSEEEELAAKMGDLNLSLDKLKAENFAEWHRIEVTALWQWAVEIHERLGNMGSLGCFPTIKANLDKEQVEKFEAGGYDTRFVFVLLQNKLKTVVALIKDHFGKGPRFLSAGFHVIAVRKSDGAVSMRLVHVKNSWRNSDSWGGNAVATQLAAFDSVEQWYGQAGEQLAEETIYAEGLQEVVQKYAGAGAEDKNGTKYVNGIPITTKFNSDFALKKAEWFQGDAQDPARNIDNLIDICGTFILFGDDVRCISSSCCCRPA